MTRDERNTLLKSFRNGMTQISSTGSFKILCDFDISHFPFDRQLCIIRIDSEGYVIQMQELQARNLNLDEFTVNEQWNVSFGFINNRNKTYASGRTYSIVEFGFYMKRKASFFTIAFIVPMVASSCIELASFALEIGDPNRIHLSFTCFLSFTFFLSMLIEKLPQNSESMPFLLFSICIVAVSVCIVIILQSISFHLATSQKLRLKFKKDKCYQVARIINGITFVFYTTVIIVTQLVIPFYMYWF